jgi:predicted RNA-binding protein YlxR (DUF448 family)
VSGPDTPSSLPARHVPERSCVACRRKRPQPELRRVSRVGGEWRLVAGPRTGRGAYVCADSPACWQPGRLRRAFGAQAPALSTLLSASA